MDVRKIKIELTVHIAHDEEADVWYVAQSDIPGLHLEADDPLALVRRLTEAAPELIELNAAEILHNHTPKSPPAVSLRPVFDSPLELAYA